MNGKPDAFIETCLNEGLLREKEVLEIGCGTGTYSRQLAEHCQNLTSIDPDERAIERAERYKPANATFRIAAAEQLPFANDSFDLVCFTHSFRCVPTGRMLGALREAARVCAAEGRIAFLERELDGSYYEAEERFCASSDATSLRMALSWIERNEYMRCVSSITYEEVVRGERPYDFVRQVGADRRLGELPDYLKERSNGRVWELLAPRRITLCTPTR